ncbi:MAG: nuclear transport factor 2 family protein [Actinophytocola sp.]|uniref:nuclear transport factor 2 family protein n=1 Tax=Actinophytocola sp. TaxID=1872138 RepID=UPI003C794E0A
MTAVVTEELVAIEERAWSALTSEQDAAEYYEHVLSHDMVMVLPGMVLARAEALESWMGSVPWRDFEIEDARAVWLDRNAALLTYRATARRAEDTASYRALCTSVYRMPDGRWWLVFQQQTPLSNSMGCAGS